jgi:ABC-type polar amino acid transport system ATPase subunit
VYKVLKSGVPVILSVKSEPHYFVTMFRLLPHISLLRNTMVGETRRVCTPKMSPQDFAETTLNKVAIAENLNSIVKLLHL